MPFSGMKIHQLATAFLLLEAVQGWVVSPLSTNTPTPSQMTSVSSSMPTRRATLFNIPPPSEDNVAEFVEYASRQSPPSSFYELQQDCIRAARLAIQDGFKLLEVEFPPLPAAVLEMDDVSAYDVSQANLKLALEFSKGLITSLSSSTSQAQKRVAVVFPDEAEKDFAVEKTGTANPYPGITIDCLRRSDPNDDRWIKPEQLLLGLFGRGVGIVEPIEGVDIYVCLTVSAQELPDLEVLHQQAPNAVIVFYNLKLDTLRGDLGAPAFPPKEFHDNFLSLVKPVYYLRTRQYSRSTPNPPFMVNYQGCLFRCYPGEYQTLLDTGNGKYRRLKSNPYRPPLGTFKEELTDALKDQGVLQEESDALNFLRTGYKTSTWWEDERPQANDAWRT